MAKWNFRFIDNSGKRQFFTVTASSKPAAIEKGITKAKKHAKGDCNAWECSLLRA